jgi:hypothetical protein
MRVSLLKPDALGATKRPNKTKLRWTFEAVTLALVAGSSCGTKVNLALCDEGIDPAC